MYLSMDGDDIGSKLEGFLLNGQKDQAKSFCQQVNTGMSLIRDFLFNCGELIIFGGDNLIIEVKRKNSINIAKQIQDIFFKTTGCTVTIGIGDSVLSCFLALRKGKCFGKNTIIQWEKEI